MSSWTENRLGSIGLVSLKIIVEVWFFSNLYPSLQGPYFIQKTCWSQFQRKYLFCFNSCWVPHRCRTLCKTLKMPQRTRTYNAFHHAALSLKKTNLWKRKDTKRVVSPCLSHCECTHNCFHDSIQMRERLKYLILTLSMPLYTKFRLVHNPYLCVGRQE